MTAAEEKGTAYVVLRQATWAEMPGSRPIDEDPVDYLRPVPGTFQLIEEGDPGSGPIVVRAANDIAALKAVEALLGSKLEHGAVAVPARSWRLRKPEEKVERRTLWI